MAPVAGTKNDRAESVVHEQFASGVFIYDPPSQRSGMEWEGGSRILLKRDIFCKGFTLVTCPI